MSEKSFLGCAMKHLQCVNAVEEWIQADSIEGAVGGADVGDYLSVTPSSSLCRAPVLRIANRGEPDGMESTVWRS